MSERPGIALEVREAQPRIPQLVGVTTIPVNDSSTSVGLRSLTYVVARSSNLMAMRRSVRAGILGSLRSECDRLVLSEFFLKKKTESPGS